MTSGHHVTATPAGTNSSASDQENLLALLGTGMYLALTMAGRYRNHTVRSLASLVMIAGISTAWLRACCCQEAPELAEASPTPCHGSHSHEPARQALPDGGEDCEHACFLQQRAISVRTENLNSAPLPSGDATPLQVLNTGIHASCPAIEQTRGRAGLSPPDPGPPILASLLTILRI